MKLKAKFYITIAIILFWIPLHGQWVKTDEETFHDMLPTNPWMRLIEYCKNDQIEKLLHTGLFESEISENEILQLDSVISSLYRNYDKLMYLLVGPSEDDPGL